MSENKKMNGRDMLAYGTPDVIVPVRMSDPEDCKQRIIWLNEKFGFKRFGFYGLSKGHRSKGYPSRESYIETAKKFAEVREWLVGRGLSCGWYCSLTVKSGPGFSPIVREDGSGHPFANCPLDESFAETLSSDIAAFSAVAKPDFVFLEDDFNITGSGGCYCERHLAAFAEKVGARYEREELIKVLKERTPEAIALHRAWRELKKDTLVLLAKKIRAAMDEVCPEIPIGLMQSGASDRDGDFTEAVTKALAGRDHTPFVRLYGTFYSGFKSKMLPAVMLHALHFTTHMSDDILRYHETDTYPHNRYFTSGKQITAMMAAAYSYGMVGSLFFAQQMSDQPWEEDAYCKAYFAESKRFEKLTELVKELRTMGVELDFDSFYNTLDEGNTTPFFADCIGRFGIPFTTARSGVVFWDARQAKYADEATVLRYLAGNLFVDGEAAHILCERGFGKYLGVQVGDNLLSTRPQLVVDIGAKEIISEEFVSPDEGREMPSAHCYSPAGNGKWMEISSVDPGARIVSNGYDSKLRLIAPTMTYFENSIGGRVCVMSLTVQNNPSQALFNHRRRRLIQRMIRIMSDEYPMVTNAPEIYAVAMEPKSENSSMLGMLTIINLCEDDAENLHIHLPPAMRECADVLTIAKDGTLIPLEVKRVDDGIILNAALRHLIPEYVILRKNDFSRCTQ